MATPKPVAPNTPLSFRPPEKPKKAKKQRENKTKEVVVEDIAVLPGEEGQKAIFDFSAKDTKTVEKPKKPFVLDPRLTQRPFHDDRLMQLKSRLQRPSFKNR